MNFTTQKQLKQINHPTQTKKNTILKLIVFEKERTWTIISVDTQSTDPLFRRRRKFFLTFSIYFFFLLLIGKFEVNCPPLFSRKYTGKGVSWLGIHWYINRNVYNLILSDKPSWSNNLWRKQSRTLRIHIFGVLFG